MNNIKTIILLCFLYYISTVHMMNNSAVEMAVDTPEGDKFKINKPVVDIETGTPEVDELEIDKPKINTPQIAKIAKWSNFLKPGNVVDWRRLYSNLSGYYNKYSFLKSINSNRTSNIEEIRKWSNSLKLANVVDWRRLYSNLSGYYYKDYLKKVLAITRCPTDIINDLAEKYIETNWPPGISTYLERLFGEEIMNSYNCRRLPDTTISKEVVVVLASDNKTMPEDMIDEIGFVMFFSKGGTADKENISVEMGTNTPKVNEFENDNLKINKSEIDETVHLMTDVVIEIDEIFIDTSDISEIEKWSNSLKPAKVVRWGRLYSTFSRREISLTELLVKNGCPTHIANGLAEKYNENHWPPEEVVIVFASDNKTIPKEMIDELGFVMFFNKGGTED